MAADMPRGASGRIVLEIDPAVKRQLYSALAMEGITLKEWFLQSTRKYLNERRASTRAAPENTRETT